MDISKLFDPNEKPLDNLVSDGGFCGIFRTIGCVGDSLSSGEFESFSDEGIAGYHDSFEYSWGQYLARDSGTKVYNFSKGGMTSRTFIQSFGDTCGAWNTPCQAYILALGVNDLGSGSTMVLGDISDIGTANNDTFAGAFTNIIIRLKRKQPKAKFFLMTIPKADDETQECSDCRDGHSKILYEIANRYKNCYVLDFRKYAPVYDADFRKKFFLGGHLNPMGYLLTARMTESYIDYIIRHNTDDFKQVGFIGTPYFNCNEPW